MYFECRDILGLFCPSKWDDNSPTLQKNEFLTWTSECPELCSIYLETFWEIPSQDRICCSRLVWKATAYIRVAVTTAELHIKWKIMRNRPINELPVGYGFPPQPSSVVVQWSWNSRNLDVLIIGIIFRWGKQQTLPLSVRNCVSDCTTTGKFDLKSVKFNGWLHSISPLLDRINLNLSSVWRHWYGWEELE